MQAGPAMKQYYDALSKRLARFRDPNADGRSNDTMLVGIGEDGQLLHMYCQVGMNALWAKEHCDVFRFE